MKVELVGSALAQFAPVTNHYRVADGWLLVSVPADDVPLPEALAILRNVPVVELISGPTVVFRADESATVIDVDGDPSNGMTPLAEFPPGTSHAEALEALGYVVE